MKHFANSNVGQHLSLRRKLSALNHSTTPQNIFQVARQEQETEEQFHLRDKEQLKNQLHDKDKQYQQLIRFAPSTKLYDWVK